MTGVRASTLSHFSLSPPSFLKTVSSMPKGSRTSRVASWFHKLRPHGGLSVNRGKMPEDKNGTSRFISWISTLRRRRNLHSCASHSASLSHAEAEVHPLHRPSSPPLPLAPSSMQYDSYIDPLVPKYREPPLRDHDEYYSGGDPETSSSAHPYAVNIRNGAFHGAHHFVIQNATIAERIDYVSGGATLFNILYPYTDPNAAMDSSARDPPPKCHPGTRKRLNEALAVWLDAINRECDMLWLYGSAGTGKSAIAQTFAEACFEAGRLGAAFFFSRPNGRDRPETVIPSLTYQLCLHCPPYKSVIADVLANDPQLLQKAVSLQFKRLIVEPLLHLRAKGHAINHKPLTIILDGLDECAGAQAQCQFVSLISEHVRSKKGSPVLWLLCSRPEPHLKHAISRIPEFGRQELLLDNTGQHDVELFLRDGFAKIKDENPYTTTSDWPSKEQFDIILRTSSGHFQVATTAVNFVNDPTAQNPPKQLDILVAYLEGAKKIGALNPLAALDLLYTRILSDIPENVLPHTQRILAQVCYSFSAPVQILSNILRLDQSTFYSALSRLHSVLRIPTPEKAHKERLSFYHASFEDFLTDPNRAGKFILKEDWAFATLAKTCLSWYEVITSHPDSGIADSESGSTKSGQTACLPGLSWASAQEMNHISEDLIDTIHSRGWMSFKGGRQYRNDELFTQLRDFDFRKVLGSPEMVYLVNWIYKHYSPNDILRTEPSNDADFRLIKHIELLTGEASGFEKAKLPVTSSYFNLDGLGIKQYLFLGCGQKVALVLFTRAGMGSSSRARLDILVDGNPPSEKQVSEYRGWVRDGRRGWMEPFRKTEGKIRRLSFS